MLLDLTSRILDDRQHVGWVAWTCEISARVLGRRERQEGVKLESEGERGHGSWNVWQPVNSVCES